MNFFRCFIFVFYFISTGLYANSEPLTIGVTRFFPPFVMQGANEASYGFDIDMMSSLCKLMNRKCQFRIMNFDNLIPAVMAHKVDLAISIITITPERSQLVNFSIPYLLSYSRFLTKNPDSALKGPFSLSALDNKKIGVVTGSIFPPQIKEMNIKDPTIKEYDTVELLLDALITSEIDYILIDNPTALYWEANSSGALKTEGPTYLYGYGVGIAVNKDNKNLLNSINNALRQYQSSVEFKQNYNKYIPQL